MKVCFKNLNKFFSDEQIEVIKTFIKFIQGETPLKKDIHITFLDKRENGMTTGQRRSHHIIKILVHERLLIDVLRTLAHEWVHEFQHQKLGLKEKTKIQDIGGEEENMANIIAGIFMKQFQKEYPEMDKVLYDEE
jgi:hypothetical protein